MNTYCLNNPINNYDPNGLWTLGVSLNGNANLLIGCSISIGFVFDDNGNFDWQWSYSFLGIGDTISIGCFDIGAGISVQVTDRDTVSGLYGPTTYIGASGGEIWYLGGDVLSFSDAKDTNAKINGAQITGGLGLGFDLHITQTDTKQLVKKNTLGLAPVNLNSTKNCKKNICNDKKSLNKVTIKWG